MNKKVALGALFFGTGGFLSASLLLIPALSGIAVLLSDPIKAITPIGVCILLISSLAGGLASALKCQSITLSLLPCAAVTAAVAVLSTALYDGGLSPVVHVLLLIAVPAVFIMGAAAGVSIGKGKGKRRKRRR